MTFFHLLFNHAGQSLWFDTGNKILHTFLVYGVKSSLSSSTSHRSRHATRAAPRAIEWCQVTDWVYKPRPEWADHLLLCLPILINTITNSFSSWDSATLPRDATTDVLWMILPLSVSDLIPTSCLSMNHWNHLDEDRDTPTHHIPSQPSTDGARSWTNSCSLTVASWMTTTATPLLWMDNLL